MKGTYSELASILRGFEYRTAEIISEEQFLCLLSDGVLPDKRIHYRHRFHEDCDYPDLMLHEFLKIRFGLGDTPRMYVNKINEKYGIRTPIDTFKLGIFSNRGYLGKDAPYHLFPEVKEKVDNQRIIDAIRLLESHGYEVSKKTQV